MLNTLERETNRLPQSNTLKQLNTEPYFSPSARPTMKLHLKMAQYSTAIGHLRLAFCLCIKTSLSAKQMM